jgi:hypothetical protein
VIISPGAFPRVAERLELEGTVLTGTELARLAERYVGCPGTEPWGVREYARGGVRGAREYRVVRGTGIQDVFTSDVRASAAAVRMALNELESEGG